MGFGPYSSIHGTAHTIRLVNELVLYRYGRGTGFARNQFWAYHLRCWVLRNEFGGVRGSRRNMYVVLYLLSTVPGSATHWYRYIPADADAAKGSHSCQFKYFVNETGWDHRWIYSFGTCTRVGVMERARAEKNYLRVLSFTWETHFSTMRHSESSEEEFILQSICKIRHTHPPTRFVLFQIKNTEK